MFRPLHPIPSNPQAPAASDATASHSSIERAPTGNPRAQEHVDKADFKALKEREIQSKRTIERFNANVTTMLEGNRKLRSSLEAGVYSLSHLDLNNRNVAPEKIEPLRQKLYNDCIEPMQNLIQKMNIFENKLKVFQEKLAREDSHRQVAVLKEEDKQLRFQLEALSTAAKNVVNYGSGS